VGVRFGAWMLVCLCAVELCASWTSALLGGGRYCWVFVGLLGLLFLFLPVVRVDDIL
jgi:hypothetical protein